MKKTAVRLMVTIMTVCFVQVALAEDVIAIGDKIFKIYVDSLETGSSFPAYPDKNPPFIDKKTTTLTASTGNLLVRVKLVVDNITVSKQPFRIGDIQLMCNGKKLLLKAAGLSDLPYVIKAADQEKERNAITMVESRKESSGGSYRFPIYVFEAAQGCALFKIQYKSGTWVEVKK